MTIVCNSNTVYEYELYDNTGVLQIDWNFYVEQNIGNFVDHTSTERVKITKASKIVFERNDIYTLKFDLDFHTNHWTQLEMCKIGVNADQLIDYDILSSNIESVMINKGSKTVYHHKPWKDKLQIEFDWGMYLKNKWLRINSLDDFFGQLVTLRRLTCDYPTCHIAYNAINYRGYQWCGYFKDQCIVKSTVLPHIHTFKIEHIENVHWKQLLVFNTITSIKRVTIITKWKLWDIILQKTLDIIEEIEFDWEIDFKGKDPIKINYEVLEQRCHAIGRKVECVYMKGD
eukprot:369759_1